ncbi:hypothetical protein LIT13_06580 [Flavobacterium psychrophilum]|uniref:hypothetical protein n=1 Tax=Flavobacterium phage Fpv8 TaxID=1814288 RepID=UPI00078DB032|nr:hypothetical protein [Flavobacterium psychrophilum]YP_009322304.1 hypothetical protein BOW76_gp33 [Flavobacterium phage Fpv8]YP_009322410.1 hypothetical protein BOW79_gp33 [Flavobacterium phage Fpv5]YP_009323704.1 hypothetical protein BOW72_gp33 [Flavobacterium phage Fpv10]YP_009324556.1 hypothetical protein BOW78_gp33 [Flavobacterium phage Fpv6]YP_009325244.1 hypothetical protein BOW83_gp33 [Flavobacterium phage Fpv11]ALN97221.1 hypothetical protein [Flavobacterium phage FpV9]QCW19963.1 
MAKNNSKLEIVEISKIDTQQLKEIQGLKEKQLEIVKANPYVEIKDKETYEKAKASRTTLLTASTDVEKQESTLTKFLNGFKKSIQDKFKEFSTITREAYDKQQAEVKRYEDILAAEKERLANIEKERVDELKNNISELEKEFGDKIETMTFDTIDVVDTEIQKTISERSGTFQEFDLLFDQVIDFTNDKFKAKKETLIEENKQKEIKRKEVHQNKINQIELKAKEFIYEMTFETIRNVELTVNNLVEQEIDFEEFQDDFDFKVLELKDLFEKQETKLVNEENARIQKQKDDEELEELRKEKKYNDRSKKLTSIGMECDENGNFQIYDVVYQKTFIVSDNDEEFEKTIENIQGQIEIKSKPEPEPETTNVENEVAAPIEENKSDFEKAIESVVVDAENVSSNEIIEEIKKDVQLGTPETIGQLREILSKYADSTQLNFRNQPRQSLFETEIGGDIIIYFQ